MFFKKYGDICVGIFFMALSAALMIGAQMLPESQVMEIGPDFMPMVIGAVTFVLAAVLTVLAFKNFKSNAAEVDRLQAEGKIAQCDYKRVISSIILVLIYVMILRPIGFLISTLLYLMTQMYVLSPDDERTSKHIIRLVIINVIFTLVVFFLFRYGFKIVLPAGIFTINL